MQNNLDPITAIRVDIATRTHGDDIGMFTVKTANETVHDAALRPVPRNLFMTLWYEGEVTCLFADSNVGKSIFAVQIADQIATTEPVLYVDCELSEKQFQLRYTDKESGIMHKFPRRSSQILRTLPNNNIVGSSSSTISATCAMLPRRAPMHEVSR